MIINETESSSDSDNSDVGNPVIPQSTTALSLPNLADRLDQATERIRDTRSLMELAFRDGLTPVAEGHESEPEEDVRGWTSPAVEARRTKRARWKATESALRRSQETGPPYLTTFDAYLSSKCIYFGTSLREGRCLFSAIASLLGLPFSERSANAVRAAVI